MSTQITTTQITMPQITMPPHLAAICLGGTARDPFATDSVQRSILALPHTGLLRIGVA
ncbi:MAG: hypothetical protein AB8G14_16340 [Ilumatobacter sp.]